MAEIRLSELRLGGSELLQDSESFLTELDYREVENVVGGDSNSSIVVRVLPLPVKPFCVTLNPIIPPFVLSVTAV